MMASPHRMIAKAAIAWLVAALFIAVLHPPAAILVILTCGIALAFLPLVPIDPLFVPQFTLAMTIAILVYAFFFWSVVLRQVQVWSVAMTSLVGFWLAFGVFLVVAELRWTQLINAQIRSGRIDCVLDRETLFNRITSATSAFHSDERMFYTPHATAAKDRALYIWSFSEGRFVPWTRMKSIRLSCTSFQTSATRYPNSSDATA